MIAVDEGTRGDIADWPTIEDDADMTGRPAAAPPPGLAAGLAFCIPTLSLIGLLYSLLK